MSLWVTLAWTCSPFILKTLPIHIPTPPLPFYMWNISPFLHKKCVDVTEVVFIEVVSWEKWKTVCAPATSDERPKCHSETFSSLKIYKSWMYMSGGPQNCNVRWREQCESGKAGEQREGGEKFFTAKKWIPFLRWRSMCSVVLVFLLTLPH